MNTRARLPVSRPGWMRLARIAFLVAVALGIALLLAERGGEITRALATASPAWLLAALALGAGQAVCAFGSWWVLAPGAPGTVPLRAAAQLFFVSQLGKYLPGGVWSFAAAAEFGRDAGFGRAATVASFGIALAIGIGTGVLLAVLAVPSAIGAGALPILAATSLSLLFMLLPPVRRRLSGLLDATRAFTPHALLRSVGLALAGWLFAGGHIFVLAIALGADLSPSDIAWISGAYAAAWVIGFLFVIAPAGFGPREATLIALLAYEMPLGQAASIALVSRVTLTLADVLLAALASRLHRQPSGR